MISDSEQPKTGLRKVPIAWEALEDAFENNAPEVHSYLNLDNGDVIRIVDGVAEPQMHTRIAGDPDYLLVDPVSSREQYRWMERYIATVEEPDLRQKLVGAIDGKGAFRRFKDVLMAFPVERERWFTFRSERLRSAMQTWLDAHSLESVAREAWEVPSAEAVADAVERDEKARPARKTRTAHADAARQRLRELVELLPVRELDMALEFLEFLRERRPIPRMKSKAPDRLGEDEASTHSSAPPSAPEE
ncbi:MAG TPA: UPF0158 family protein [Polyangiales bacterium]|jgi:hypothetical protein